MNDEKSIGGITLIKESDNTAIIHEKEPKPRNRNKVIIAVEGKFHQLPHRSLWYAIKYQTPYVLSECQVRPSEGEKGQPILWVMFEGITRRWKAWTFQKHVNKSVNIKVYKEIKLHKNVEIEWGLGESIHP